MRRHDGIDFSELSDGYYSDGETSEDMRLGASVGDDSKLKKSLQKQVIFFTQDIHDDLPKYDIEMAYKSIYYPASNFPNEYYGENKYYSRPITFSIQESVDYVLFVLPYPNMKKGAYDIYKDRSTIIGWCDYSGIPINEFSSQISSAIKKNYLSISKQIRFQSMIPPNIEKLSSINTLRPDFSTRRAIFHYCDVNSNGISNKNISFWDQKSSSIQQYAIKDIFELFKAPSCYIMDCDSSEDAIGIFKSESERLHSRQEKTEASLSNSLIRPVNWNDFVCFCSCSSRQKNLLHPKLPRDIFSTILTNPLPVAILVHIIVFYNSSFPDSGFPLSYLSSLLGNNNSQDSISLLSLMNLIIDSIFIEKYSPMLYSNDKVLSSLSRNFVLAQFLLNFFDIKPISHPKLPELWRHKLWQQWTASVDIWIQSSCTPKPSFYYDFLGRSTTSCEVLLSQVPHTNIPNTLFYVALRALFSDVVNPSNLFSKFAEYSVNNDDAQKIISNYISVNQIIEKIKQNKSKPTEMQALSVLLLLWSINQGENISEEVSYTDYSTLIDYALDEKYPQPIRACLFVILTSLHNVVNKENYISSAVVLQLSSSLHSFDSILLPWVLNWLSVVLDESPTFRSMINDQILHLQASNLLFHRSPECRASSLVLLSSLYVGKECYYDIEFFLLSIVTFNDSSYVVRLRFLYHVIKFLTNHLDDIRKYFDQSQFIIQHESFYDVISNFFGFTVDKCFWESSPDQHTRLLGVITGFSRRIQDYSAPINLALQFIIHFGTDPCQKISDSAGKFRNILSYVIDLAPFTKTHITTPLNGSLFPDSSYFVYSYFRASFPKLLKALPLSKDSSKEADKPRSQSLRIEKEYLSFDLKKTHLQCRGQFFENEIRFTKIASHNEHLGFVVSSRFIAKVYNNDSSKYVKLFHPGESISDIGYISIDDTDYIYATTFSGNSVLKNPDKTYPSTIWSSPVRILASQNPSLLTIIPEKKVSYNIQGNNPLILWDLNSERMIGEWRVDPINRNASALSYNIMNNNISYIGYDKGAFVAFDTRESKSILTVNLEGKIISIKNCSNGSAYFATDKGSCFNIDMRNNSVNHVFRHKKLGFSSFDASFSHQFFAISQDNDYPQITTLDGSLVHTIKENQLKGSHSCIHRKQPVVHFFNGSCVFSYNVLQ